MANSAKRFGLAPRFGQPPLEIFELGFDRQLQGFFRAGRRKDFATDGQLDRDKANPRIGRLFP